MVGGLAASSRKWYFEQILKAIQKNGGKASVAQIVYELNKLNQKRYPIQTDRIIALLKELRAIGVLKYHKSEKKIRSKWALS